MNTFIAGLLAFLMLLFPHCTYLQQQYQQLSFSWEATANSIVNAVDGKDIVALEAMMCLNIKENTTDLPNKIGELIDAIDGDILSFTWDTIGGFEASHGIGKQLRQKILRIFITTTEGVYYLGVMWEYYNSFQPAEMGIRNISVADHGTTGEIFVLITATDGVGSWHE
jgi:hypothetical protein